MKYVLFIVCLVYAVNQQLDAISSLAYNDPYPIYSAIYDPYLTVWTKECMKSCSDSQPASGECFALSISPFFQQARSARTFAHDKVPLGDRTGRWNMLALLYGGIPAGNSLVGTQLGLAKQNIFTDFFSTAGLNPAQQQDTIFSSTNNAQYLLIDPDHKNGFFSAPVKYKKMGVRGEIACSLFCNLGLTLQVGVSEMRQTVTALTDLSHSPTECMDGTGLTEQPFGNNFCRNIPVLQPNGSWSTCPSCTGSPDICACTNPLTQVENQLMEQDKARLIFEQIGLEPCNFEETSFEDARLIVWWRDVYDINRTRKDWPEFFITPAVSFNVIFPAAKAQKRNQLFALPFGNDRHWAIGGDVGLSIDFVETVEIAGNAGVNYFFARTIKDYRIPTDKSQSGIFPFATTARVKPGLNFNFNLLMHAYRFYDRFSAWAEWVFVKHETDDIKIKDQPAPFFLPEVAACTTKFTAQFVNAAVYYDISPNISLGILAQFPVAQRNSYRSTTYLGTFRAVF